MASPSHLTLNYTLFNACGFGFLKDISIRSERIPFDPEDSPKAVLMKPLQYFDMTAVGGPCFRCIEKNSEDTSFINT